MTDIFREVEEDVRREQYEKLWNKYRDHIIAAAALVVIAVAGFQLYRVYEQREVNKASIAYQAAAQLLDGQQPRAAEPDLAALAKSAPGGYAKLARLAQADALFAAGDHVAAIRLYEQIANSNDPYLGAVARIHAAWAIADGASKPEIETLLAPLTDPTNPWHSLAQEIFAYEDMRAGDAAQALKSYQALAADPNAPSSLHTRATAMVRFLKGGGDINYGQVPQPAPAHVNAIPANKTKGPPVR
ncbi:MAG TPA: tetratricopeptide repeat protein [Rhizomicrobium sp.]